MSREKRSIKLAHHRPGSVCRGRPPTVGRRDLVTGTSLDGVTGSLADDRSALDNAGAPGRDCGRVACRPDVTQARFRSYEKSRPDHRMSRQALTVRGGMR